MANNKFLMNDCARFLDFPLHIHTAARLTSNRYRHNNNCLSMIYLCFVLAEEQDEILELDGVPRLDSNPPFMRVTFPGTRAHHLRAGSRNELFFTYDGSSLESFSRFGFHNCNFVMTERFSSLLDETEKLLTHFRAVGVADQLDRLAVMLGLEAMLSSLSDSEDRPSPGTERIHRIRKYFQFHFAEHPDIEKILPGFGISRRTFYREWGQAFAESPAEYLLKLRINEARMLLQNSSLRIYEIASECGYPNVTYFSRCFAQAIGMTPQAYRRLCRKR